MALSYDDDEEVAKLINDAKQRLNSSVLTDDDFDSEEKLGSPKSRFSYDDDFEESVINEVADGSVTDNEDSDGELPLTDKTDDAKKESTGKKKKKYKNNGIESPLDKYVRELLDKKQSLGYNHFNIPECSRMDISLFEECADALWDNGLEDVIKEGFDVEKELYVISYVSEEIAKRDNTERQKVLDITTTSDDEIGYTLISASQEAVEKYAFCLENGSFDKKEREKITELMKPLATSLYKEFMPSGNFNGKCEDVDIISAISTGLTKALNNYAGLGVHNKVKFASYAYSVIKNECIDILRHFNRAKKNNIPTLSMELEVYGSSGKDSADGTTTIGDTLAVNEHNEDMDAVIEGYDHKEFMNKIFNAMYAEGREKEVRTEITVMKLMFGVDNGYPMSFVDVSNTLNMTIDKVKKFKESGFNRFKQTAFKLGYSLEDILELLS